MNILQQPRMDAIPFVGGLDLVSGAWNAAPGTLRRAQNYEIDINGGYQDILGYERFDGRPRPSEAAYALLTVAISGAVAVGDTVTGQTSGATAVVLLQKDAVTLVVGKVTGTFTTENFTVSAVVQGTTTGGAIIDGEADPDLACRYTALAADLLRADIQKPAGSGKIRGVFRIGGTIYAWRNNAGATACVLFKSTAGGWTAVDLGRKVDFTSGGTYVISEGSTITGATSAATATVKRVVLRSGTWAGGDAAGTLILSGQTGNFTGENLNVGANLNVATIAGNSSAITMLPGGEFEHMTYNFGPGARVYGCDAANKCFEFDGDVFVPITTGLTVDKPNHIICHKNHLIVSYGSSVIISGDGSPYLFDSSSGGAEINAGDTVNDFASEAGSGTEAALGIYCASIINVLYGSGTDDWNMVPYRNGVGAESRTVQQIMTTIFLDKRGISTLQQTLAYGNFQLATISKLIQPLINEKRLLSTCSCVLRNKNQYRLFFSDGSALYVTFSGGKLMGVMPQQFPGVIRCIDSSETPTGSEEIYAGSDDGYVYQMEKGYSFDGAEIEAFIMLHYHASKMLRTIKRYLTAAFELSGSGYARFNFGYELGYSSTALYQPEGQAMEAAFSPARWDAFVWDAFVWDATQLAPKSAKLTGGAENISIVIRKQSNCYAPLRFVATLLSFIPRRVLRN